MKDKGVLVRRTAAEAMGQIGPDARSAVPALTEALKDEDEKVRQAAQAALKKVNAEK
jgi:HEAT repeat protein